MTLETAPLETPASSATSEMDGRLFVVVSACSDIRHPVVQRSMLDRPPGTGGRTSVDPITSIGAPSLCEPVDTHWYVPLASVSPHLETAASASSKSLEMKRFLLWCMAFDRFP